MGHKNPIPMSSEFPWIEQLVEDVLKPHPPHLLIPPGDDCAQLVLQEPQLLFAADMLMEGVHFDLKQTSPAAVGGKAVKVNLSDIAAMAGSPLSVTICLALPRKPDGATLGREVMAGAAAVAREYGISIAGGDTNGWDGPLVISVAIVGTPHARGSVTRGGAQPGDWVFVTGPLGGSLAKGRHLHFEPRVTLAQRLHKDYGLTSMLDLSDGLGSDLRHILAQSRVGAVLDRQQIPIHPDVADSTKNPLDHALSDGEDFELCYTLRAQDGARLLEDLRQLAKSQGPLALGTSPTDRQVWSKITKIGEITAHPGVLVWREGDPITALGYQHQIGVESEPSLECPPHDGQQATKPV